MIVTSVSSEHRKWQLIGPCGEWLSLDKATDQKTQNFVLQMGGIHGERVATNDFNAQGVQAATCSGSWDATLDSVAHVRCVSDKFQKAVIIAILSAGRGNHEPVMVPAAIKSAFRNRFARAGWPRRRQLARKTPECCDSTLGKSDDRTPEDTWGMRCSQLQATHLDSSS